MRMLPALLAAFPLASALVAQSDFSDSPTNPAMARITDVPKLPRVLLIGDSISIGYTLPVRAALAGQANVHRTPDNGASTTNGLAKLDDWLGTNRWDVIHFNWGLHDLKLNPDGSHFVPLPQYETNLVALVRRLRATGAALIWASTTPVPKGKLAPPRGPGEETNFNAVARRVMERHGVAIDDLHAWATPRLSDWQRPANVHFTPAGSQALARSVAEAIRAAIRKRPVSGGSP